MQKFSNNASTTLGSSLSTIATSMTVTNSSGFAVLSAGEFELITLESGDSREIIAVTARTGNTWTIERAQEGTTAGAWPTGTTVDARLTAGTLEAFQGGGGEIGIDLEALDQSGNARGSKTINLQPGRDDAANVASASDSIVIGYDASAISDSSIAIGAYARGNGHGSIALGKSARAGNNASDSHVGIAIGRSSKALGHKSIAFGEDQVAFATHAIQLTGFFALPNDNWFDGQFELCASTRATFATAYVDLGVPPDWEYGTYTHGDVVKPTTGGSVQYQVWCDYDASTLKHKLAVTGGSEPVWPGNNGSVPVIVGSQDAYWRGIDWIVGYIAGVVPKWLTFVPTEIAFFCQKHTTLSGTITVSVGTPAASSRVLDAAEIIITGPNQIYRCAVPNPSSGFASGESVQITVNSFASSGTCAGRFLVSGYFIENQVRT